MTSWLRSVARRFMLTCGVGEDGEVAAMMVVGADGEGGCERC
jgi:hypothetical protein